MSKKGNPMLVILLSVNVDKKLKELVDYLPLIRWMKPKLDDFIRCVGEDCLEDGCLNLEKCTNRRVWIEVIESPEYGPRVANYISSEEA